LLKNPALTSSQYNHDVGVFIRKIHDGTEQLPKPPENYQLSLLKNNQQWVETLVQMFWTIEIAAQESFFIVGDEPLCSRRSGDLFSPQYAPVAQKDPDLEVTFPLSRRMCLVARWLGTITSPKYETVPVQRVDELNIRTVLCAHHLFWSPVRTARCDEYVRLVGGRTIAVAEPPKNLSDFFEQNKGNSD
jgi:hypothetical protein